MTWFSERFGHVKPIQDLRDDEMPASLINGLWDAISMMCLLPTHSYYAGRYEGYTAHFEQYVMMFWSNVLKAAFDTRPNSGDDAYKKIRETFFKGPFHLRYDILERSAQHSRQQGYYDFCNTILERERAAFRFSGKLLIKVSDEIEFEEISIAMNGSASPSVKLHITRAAELYSDRVKPDYRNSIKESISAVEAAVSYVSGEKNYGVSRSLQKELDDNLLHPALRQGFEKLYAYTSDAAGIRHALLEDGRSVAQEDARYMLISCSAFSNYLLALASRR